MNFKKDGFRKDSFWIQEDHLSPVRSRKGRHIRKQISESAKLDKTTREWKKYVADVKSLNESRTRSYAAAVRKRNKLYKREIEEYHIKLNRCKKRQDLLERERVEAILKYEAMPFWKKLIMVKPSEFDFYFYDPMPRMPYLPIGFSCFYIHLMHPTWEGFMNWKANGGRLL